MKKQKDISNKTIMALMAVTLGITLLGTTLSIVKLNSLRDTYLFLTGAATTTATTQLTISGTTGITMHNSTINLGSGYYNTSCTTGFAWINTSAGQYNCWINSTPSSFIGHHTINNSGTTVINVTAASGASSKRDAEHFLCGSIDGCASTVAAINVTAFNNLAGSCTGTLPNFAVILSNSSNFTVTLCPELSSAIASNSINVSYYIQIPSDAGTGAKSWTVTYEATDVVG